MQIKCNICGVPVSTELLDYTFFDAWVECPKCQYRLRKESELSGADEQMTMLKYSNVKRLIKLGILDEGLNITPNAIMPVVLRQSLEKQCEILGIRLIYRRPTGKDARVDEQMATYLENRYGGFADDSLSSGCYWVKRMFEALVEGFDASKRKIQITDEELQEKCSKIHNLNDSRIVYWYEQDMYYDIEFCGEITDITKSTLRARYKASKSKKPLYEESKKDKEERLDRWRKQINNYIYNVMEMLNLWHSLTIDTWSKLTWTVLSDWKSMYSGWPDVNHVDKHGQLRLLEIKKHGDRLHTHQIYVLQKLLNVLGEDRIAIIKVGGGHFDVLYKEHTKEMDEWFNKIIDS